MSTSTTNYNLEKPTDDEFAEISVINANMDIIDTKIKTLDDVKEGLIKNAAEKTDMADVDALPMVDSVDSSKTKRITFANLKAILKAYFDTLYNKTLISNTLMATAEGSALDATQGKVLDDKISTVNASLSQISSVKTAGGTATAITFNTGTLSNGYSATFLATSNNGGSATTINGVPLYKPNTTTAPTLTAGKAYTVWYNSATTCFFIKASAEGTADAANVLAGKTFSNDNDTGIVGIMPNNGAIGKVLTTSGEQYNIPQGYHNGSGKITGASFKKTASGIFSGNGTNTVTIYCGFQPTAIVICKIDAGPDNIICACLMSGSATVAIKGRAQIFNATITTTTTGVTVGTIESYYTSGASYAWIAKE